MRHPWPDELIEKKLAVVGAAWRDLAEALMEGVQPGRGLCRPRRRLHDRERRIEGVELIDHRRERRPTKLLAAARDAHRMEPGAL